MPAALRLPLQIGSTKPSSAGAPLAYWRSLQKQWQQDACRQRRYLTWLRRSDREHAQRVARHALALFDGLSRLHNLGPDARELLEVASLLHDIGKAKSNKGHHKISLKMILQCRAIPLDDEHRPLVGLVARYHRASLPRNSHRYFRDLSAKAQQVVRRLSAILRLADGLDRLAGPSGALLVSCRVRAGIVVVNLVCAPVQEQDGHLPLRRTILFEQLFAKRIVVRSRCIFGVAPKTPSSNRSTRASGKQGVA